MLAVTIEKYIPHVGCSGPRQDFNSISQALINSIPTDMEYMKFGEEGAEAQIQVRLPQTFHPTPRVSGKFPAIPTQRTFPGWLPVD
jgi:hypothetical protein